MWKKTKRDRELEILAMAKKLGAGETFGALWNEPWSEEVLKAVKNCEVCSRVDECHLFLRGTVDAANNKHWWFKGFCPNAELLLRLAERSRRKLGKT